MARKKKPNRIKEAGVRVRLFRRGATWFADIQDAGARNKASLKTTEKKTAEDNARALAREIAKQRLIGVQPDTLTLAQLFTAYARHKGGSLLGQWRRGAETRQQLFLQAWGGSTAVASISQTSVDAYSTARRAGRLARVKAGDGDQPRMTNGRKVRGVRDGALDADFRWLSSVFNWATRHKLPDGKRLLTFNPLHDCEWPKERNVRRPIAAQDRYTRTLEQTDSVDPQGRLRCILAIARHSGRRESAICGLRAADLLLSAERIRAALAAAGMNEGDAEHMPHGAIYWSSETDKQGVLHIAPITAALRAELDRYLAINPRIGDVPLFPRPGARMSKKDFKPKAVEDQPMRRDVASRMLLKAEQLAGLPKLVGGVFHPYRRLWVTERNHISGKVVAAAVGMAVQTLRIYEQSDAAAVLRAVQNS